MTFDAQDASGPISVLDAVICISFTGANQQHILIAILTHLDMKIFVPGEVHSEVVGKDSKYPGVKARWKRLTNSGRVEVLPTLTLGDPEQADVLSRFARLRGKPAADAIRTSEHRGEFAVMAHALVRQGAGETVVVLLDDHDAQVLATGEGLAVIDMQSLLEIGHKEKVAGLETLAEVQEVYTALLPYGGGLPRWKQSDLYRSLT